jgi:fructokinase
MDRDVLVVGESLVDIVRPAEGGDLEYPGGSAANVAVALARLERPVRFATSFGDDAHGRMLRAHLEKAGVALAVDPGSLTRTSTALATIAPDGSASYEFDLEWQLNGTDALGPGAVAVHACSLGAVVQPGADVVLELLTRMRTTATVTYDVNARPAITGTGPETVESVERVVAVSDIVKASDEDLQALYPGQPIAEVADRLRSLGARAVVVTRGPDGAVWFGHRGTIDVGSVAVEVADTIGAGDTFGAALIDALWTHDLLGAGRRGALGQIGPDVVRRLLAHAVKAAAVTVSRPGADPPYRSELS